MKFYRQNGSFEFRNNPFSKNAQCMNNIFIKASVLMKFLPTKTQIKSRLIN